MFTITWVSLLIQRQTNQWTKPISLDSFRPRFLRCRARVAPSLIFFFSQFFSETSFLFDFVCVCVFFSFLRPKIRVQFLSNKAPSPSSVVIVERLVRLSSNLCSVRSLNSWVVFKFLIWFSFPSLLLICSMLKLYLAITIRFSIDVSDLVDSVNLISGSDIWSFLGFVACSE